MAVSSAYSSVGVCVCVTRWWPSSAGRLLSAGGGQERWWHHNSETPCEPAIDQIVIPCSARLSHRQAEDIIGLTHTNGAAGTHKHTLMHK